jgi:hypothetical protein
VFPSPFYFCKMTLTFVNFLHQPGPQTPYRAGKQLHEDLPQTNTLARRPDSPLGLRRRLSSICFNRGGSTRLTPPPRPAAKYLSRQFWWPDSSSDIFTPSSATNGEASSGYPPIYDATCSGGQRCPHSNGKPIHKLA